MKMQTTIQKWGNSLAIRIMGSLKTIPHFTVNMPVEIEVSKEGLTIHPIVQKKTLLFFNEAQLLKGLTAKKAHVDEIADMRYRATPRNKHYIPERLDVIFLDFEPRKGKEIGKYSPALDRSFCGGS